MRIRHALILGVFFLSCKTTQNRSRTMEGAPTGNVSAIYSEVMNASDDEASLYTRLFREAMQVGSIDRAVAYLHYFQFHPAAINDEIRIACSDTKFDRLVKETCAYLYALRGDKAPTSLTDPLPLESGQFLTEIAATKLFLDTGDYQSALAKIQNSTTEKYAVAAHTRLGLLDHPGESAASAAARRRYFVNLMRLTIGDSKTADIFEFGRKAGSILYATQTFSTTMGKVPDAENVKDLKENFVNVWTLDSKVGTGILDQLDAAQASLPAVAKGISRSRPFSSFMISDNFLPTIDGTYAGKSWSEQLRALQRPDDAFMSMKQWSSIVSKADTKGGLTALFMLSTVNSLRDPVAQLEFSTYDPGATPNPFYDFSNYAKGFDALSQQLYGQADKFSCSADLQVRCGALEYLFRPITAPMLYTISNNKGALASSCNYTGTFAQYNSTVANSLRPCGLYGLLGLFGNGSFVGYLYEDAKEKGVVGSLISYLAKGFIPDASKLTSMGDLDSLVGRPWSTTSGMTVTPIKRFICLEYVASVEDSKDWFTEDEIFQIGNPHLTRMLRKVSYYNRLMAAVATLDPRFASQNPNSFDYYITQHFAGGASSLAMHCAAALNGEASSISPLVDQYTDQNVSKLKF